MPLANLLREGEEIDVEADGTASLPDDSEGEEDIGRNDMEKDTHVEKTHATIPPVVDSTHSNFVGSCHP